MFSDESSPEAHSVSVLMTSPGEQTTETKLVPAAEQTASVRMFLQSNRVSKTQTDIKTFMNFFFPGLLIRSISLSSVFIRGAVSMLLTPALQLIVSM